MTEPIVKRARNRKKQQSVTMTDVAKLADVSPSTVSLFFRRPDAVSPSASAAITRAIDELNYVPNLIAGGLAAASSRMVSIVVPSLRNVFFADTIDAIQASLRKHGLQVMLSVSGYDVVEEEHLVRSALSWAPAGVVIAGLTHSEGTRRLLRSVSIPVVEVWELGGPQIDAAVGFHHDQVGAAAAEHLIAGGRKSLAFLGGGTREDRRVQRRGEGFVAAAQKAGVKSMIVANDVEPSAELGAELLSRALTQDPQIDGVSCSNDHIAIGVLFECQRRGIAVPGEMGIVGFGDLSFCASANPPLTTIRPSSELIGRETARIIIDHFENKTTNPVAIDTRFTLVHRGSS